MGGSSGPTAKTMLDIICPLCGKIMNEVARGVWYCELDDAKFVEDASGK